ncbi:MAG TPA: gliding motility-associated C-terminal domain-containing protein [Bacteroidales bacterium]|nr:gliding motility-associated C-terminal domain-containing protein [Bacteroidales bacterium]
MYRQAYTQNEDITGPGELNIAASGISEAVFDDDLSSFKGHDPLYKIIFKYFIEAIERRPDNSGITFVRSREAIIEILPDVIMPTAIAPNSSISNNNRSRNIFEPIISFDAKYTLTIYDRWGGIIYYGNQGWNGQNKNGEYVKEGTYIYRLVITTDNSGDVIKEGSVSVVYPK